MSVLEVHLKRPHRGWYFEIPGHPKAWKRPEQHGGRRFNASSADQNRIRRTIEAACPGIAIDADNLWGVRLLFYHSLPIGDIDNCVKNVFDAATGVVWDNDKRVREMYVATIPHQRACTVVLAYKIDADYLAGLADRMKA